MNTDIRLQIGWRHHPKIVKLYRNLGAEGVLALVALWTWVGQHRPDGDLTGLDAEDLAIAAGYPGDATSMLQALLQACLLDATSTGSIVVHDWLDNNPWAAHATWRSERAKKAAEARWSGSDKPKKNKAKNATSINKHCYKHDQAMLSDARSNAPSPSPSPSPSPKKTGDLVVSVTSPPTCNLPVGGYDLSGVATEAGSEPPARAADGPGAAATEPDVGDDDAERLPECSPGKKDAPIFLNNFNSKEQQIKRQQEIRQQLERMGIAAERLEATPNNLRALA